MTGTTTPAKSAAPDAAALIRAAGPYRPRRLRFIERRELGDWRLKVYGIATHSPDPRPALVQATIGLADTVLPRPAVGDGRYGVGVLIAHDAASVCFGLIYWWQSLNEFHQRVFVSPLDDPGAFNPIANPAAGCVWELGIVDFERRVWIEDVLANPNGPDIERYLSRRLDAEV